MGNAHSDIWSFVIGICLVEYRPWLVWLLAVLSVSGGCVFRGRVYRAYVLVLGLIMLFEVQYCVAVNSVTSVSWCSVSFIGQSLRPRVGTQLFLCRGQHVLDRRSILCARRSFGFNE